MTLKEYNDIRDHIIGEYEYSLYRKSNAEVRGLEWTAADEADYQKWCASRKRISDWQVGVMEREVLKHNYANFRQWAIGG